jgi:opacity protein-like surface antigen
MRRTILPFALAPLALGAVPAGLTGSAEAQVVFGPAEPTPGPADTAQAPVTSPLPVEPVPPQERARATEEAPVAPVPSPVLDRPVIGPAITAEISQRFELDTNLDLDEEDPGTSYFTETRLSFGLVDETPVQTLAFGFDTGVRALWPADEDFEWTVASPSTVTAEYAREWASGAFETGFAVRQRRVDFSRDLLDFLDPDLGIPVIPDDPDELEGDALERRYDASFALGLATDAPSSYAFELAANRIDYDEDQEDLTPRTTLQGSATWTLAITPLFSGALSARGFYYEADNEEETEIREAEADAGLIYTPSDLLQLSAGIGVVDRVREERTDLGGPIETVEDETGLAFRAGANYSFEEFVVTAGLRAANAPDFRVSGNLNVTYPFIGGRVNARVFQSYAGGTGGDEVRILGARIGLLRELDAFTNVDFGFSASRRFNEDDPDDPDVTRLDFTTALEYALTERISADIGYRYRAIDEESEDADSHSVFLEVGRSFVTGF